MPYFQSSNWGPGYSYNEKSNPEWGTGSWLYECQWGIMGPALLWNGFKALGRRIVLDTHICWSISEQSFKLQVSSEDSSKPTSCCLLAGGDKNPTVRPGLCAYCSFMEASLNQAVGLAIYGDFLAKISIKKKPDFKNSPPCLQIPLTPVMLGCRCFDCLSHPVSPLLSAFLRLLSGSLCIHKE